MQCLPSPHYLIVDTWIILDLISYIHINSTVRPMFRPSSILVFLEFSCPMRVVILLPWNISSSSRSKESFLYTSKLSHDCHLYLDLWSLHFHKGSLAETTFAMFRQHDDICSIQSSKLGWRRSCRPEPYLFHCSTRLVFYPIVWYILSLNSIFPPFFIELTFSYPTLSAFEIESIMSLRGNHRTFTVASYSAYH